MLDLTKLKALEMPSGEVEVEILGEKQTAKVVAPDDAIASKLFDIGTAKGKGGSEITIDVARLVLNTCVPGLTAEEAELLISKALTGAAIPIVAKARDLRMEFDKAKAEAAEKAKKKSETATSPTEKSCSSAAGNATT